MEMNVVENIVTENLIGVVTSLEQHDQLTTQEIPVLYDYVDNHDDEEDGDFITLVFYCQACGEILGIVRRRRYSQKPVPEHCRECGCSYHCEMYLDPEVSDVEAIVCAKNKWAKRNGVKMADIQIEAKCCACGKKITPGERIICVAEAELTEKTTYGSRGIRPGKLRVNFLGTKKAVYHTECYKW